jgi:hypothetical protein
MIAVASTTGIVHNPGHCIVGEIVIDATNKELRQRLIRPFGSRIDAVDNPSSAPTANSQTLDEELKKMGSLFISERYRAIDSENPIIARRTD